MGEAKKGIWMGVGLIMLLLVVSIGFMVYRTGKTTADNALEQVNELNVMLDESKYTDYDGRTITGNQVQSVLSQFNGDTIYIKVVTKTNTAGTMYNYSDTALTILIASDTNATNIRNASVKGKTNYINPNGKFLGSIARDANESIVGLIFTQQ